MGATPGVACHCALIQYFCLAGKFSWVGRETNIFLILKAFGAGVILATGFIHMFPDAAEQFSNECLGEHCSCLLRQSSMLLRAVVNIPAHWMCAIKLLFICFGEHSII